MLCTFIRKKHSILSECYRYRHRYCTPTLQLHLKPTLVRMHSPTKRITPPVTRIKRMDRWMACGMYRIFDALCTAAPFLLHTKTRGSCCARACVRCLGVSKVCVVCRLEARDGSQGWPWSYATRCAPFGHGSVDRKQKEDRAGAHAQVGRWYWTAIVRCGDNPYRVKRRRLPSSLGMVDLAPQPCVFRCSRQGSRWRCDPHTHPCHRQPAAPHAR